MEPWASKQNLVKSVSWKRQKATTRAASQTRRTSQYIYFGFWSDGTMKEERRSQTWCLESSAGVRTVWEERKEAVLWIRGIVKNMWKRRSDWWREEAILGILASKRCKCSWVFTKEAILWIFAWGSSEFSLLFDKKKRTGFTINPSPRTIFFFFFGL